MPGGYFMMELGTLFDDLQVSLFICFMMLLGGGGRGVEASVHLSHL